MKRIKITTVRRYSSNVEVFYAELDAENNEIEGTSGCVNISTDGVLDDNEDLVVGVEAVKYAIEQATEKIQSTGDCIVVEATDIIGI